MILDNPILRDLRVRQALLHAIDRDAISERLFQGKQPPAHASVSLGGLSHDDALRVRDHLIDVDERDAV